jgi:hypothetical protein
MHCPQRPAATRAAEGDELLDPCTSMCHSGTDGTLIITAAIARRRTCPQQFGTDAAFGVEPKGLRSGEVGFSNLWHHCKGVVLWNSPVMDRMKECERKSLQTAGRSPHARAWQDGCCHLERTWFASHSARTALSPCTPR